MKKNHLKYVIINWISILGVIGVNALANILPINGVQTGEVSRDFETLFTPVGFTFSIWSVIYLGLIAFTVYSSKPVQTKRSNFVTKLNHQIWISNLLNITWILTWHYYWIGASVIIMVSLLVSLVKINLTLNQFRQKVKNPNQFYLFARLPYNIYLGWIIVATIANFSAYFTSINWNGLGILPEFWLAIILIIATFITLSLVLKYKFIGAGTAIAWGIYGIVRNLQIKNEDILLINLCYIIMGFILLATVLKLTKPDLKLRY